MPISEVIFFYFSTNNDNELMISKKKKIKNYTYNKFINKYYINIY